MKNQTPVIISVGQFTNHGDKTDDFLSPADLATIAVNQCLKAVGNKSLSIIDSISVCRLFTESSPFLKPPFGCSNNLPRSITNRVGINPKYALYAAAGGDSPQRLVNTECERIFKGEITAALVVGVEATRTTKLAAKIGLDLDWNEVQEGDLVDEGIGEIGANGYERAHGIGVPIQTYSLFEHALRTVYGETPAEYQLRMAELFAPFSTVAANNPFAQFQTARTVDELKTVEGKNYSVTDIYPKYLVAQDAVDQAGAVLIVTESIAEDLGVPDENRIYLHGYGYLTDTPITERPEIHKSRAIKMAGERALSSAGLTIEEIDFFDIYSCFPSAVLCAQEALGLERIEPARLTLTGGLPFFGGAGNSYSIHAIIEMVKILRQHPDSFGLVQANGGYLSKEAVGIYSVKRPENWQPVDSSDLQRTIDDARKPGVIKEMNGPGHVISYTVAYAKGAPKFGYILGETAVGERFVASVAKGDEETLASLLNKEPVGRIVYVTNKDRKNYFHFE